MLFEHEFKIWENKNSVKYEVMGGKGVNENLAHRTYFMLL